MRRYPQRRDDNEREIIDALECAGCYVQQLDGTGLPDLLVGFRGETYLLEVKAEHQKSGKGRKRTESGLRPSQETWFALWTGKPVTIATTAAEALKAVGINAG